MPLIHCDFFAESLGLHSSMDVILPQRSLAAIARSPKIKFPVLYLLHGLSDDHTAWQRQTSLERYVEGMNLAVVMPAVHRSFYTDMAHGGRYWTFVSEELPALAGEFFPLSAARGDNFVAGLSMGGYGAFKLALSRPERFAAAASLSGALDMRAVMHGDEPGWEEEMRNVFGSSARLAGSGNDLFALAEQAARSRLRPKLYQCCGTEDELIQDNRRFRNHLKKYPFDLTYVENPGQHDWAYWDAMIQKVLEWLPLK